jgi:hypothetical protein
MIVGDNMEREVCEIFNVLTVHSPVETVETIKTSVKIAHYPTDIRTASPSNRIRNSFFFFLVSWGGVRLSPLATSDTNWLIAPVPDDR